MRDDSKSARSCRGLAAAIVILLSAVALAAAPQDSGAAKGDTSLESMQIEIWPEYDRPAALVILRGELAASVGLPAAVSLRIPASSGGPAAVAYATATKGSLLNLKYDRSEAAGFITLRFTAPARYFHVEFYDRLATGTGERTYKYLWPADLPVSWLDVVVQEPAGASNISVKPELSDKSTGSDGLLYRAAQLGPFEQGKPLPIEMRYTKSDPRTSAEILKLNAPAPAAQASTPAMQNKNYWSLLVLGAAALLVAVSGAAYFLWGRQRPPAGSTSGGRFCTKCGNAAAAGDRFCSKCGAALA